MKRTMTACLYLLLVVSSLAQDRPVRRCTESDLPVSVRGGYIKRAINLVRTYYDQLLLNVGDLLVQETFIDSYMVKDGQRYMPEFTASGQYLTPKQYMLELENTFGGTDLDKLSWEITGLTVDKNDFYMLNMASCYAIARYTLTLRKGDETVFSRDCEAYCLFPKASVSILVKLMQLNPTSQGTFASASLPVAADSGRGVPDIQVTDDMLPEPDSKPRVVSHNPDLKAEVTGITTDGNGFWVNATITNLSDNDRKFTINTGLRAYDDAGIMYSERGRNSDMCMFVGKSTRHTSWNAQNQQVVLPSGIPVKVRILITGMSGKAKGIRRLDWAMYSEGFTRWNNITVQMFDLYRNAADKLARPVLMPERSSGTFPSFSSSCKGLAIHVDKVRASGTTCILDCYIRNLTRKDGKLEVHRSIRAYDNLGNEYIGDHRNYAIRVYAGKDKLPSQWDTQSHSVVLPPDIPFKVRVEIHDIDPDATSIERLVWSSFSEYFGLYNNARTFTVSHIPLK